MKMIKEMYQSSNFLFILFCVIGVLSLIFIIIFILSIIKNKKKKNVSYESEAVSDAGTILNENIQPSVETNGPITEKVTEEVMGEGVIGELPPLDENMEIEPIKVPESSEVPVENVFDAPLEVKSEEVNVPQAENVLTNLEETNVLEDSSIVEPQLKETVNTEPIVNTPVMETPIAEEPSVLEEPSIVEPQLKETVNTEPIIDTTGMETPVAEEPSVLEAPKMFDSESTESVKDITQENPATDVQEKINDDIIVIDGVEIPLS